MNKFAKFLLILMTVHMFISCEDNNQEAAESINTPDLIPPTVYFSSPSYNQTVYGQQAISIVAQDDIKVQEIEIHVKRPSSNEFSSVVSWTNLTDAYASYSYNWNTLIESNGQYSIKVIARDHSSYVTGGNSGASQEIQVYVYNQDEDSDSNPGAVDGYIAVKNISHNKLMGSVYGSQTRYREIQYASGEGLDECSCSACNPNNQYDFTELYYKSSIRSIKYKKAGDQDYQYTTVPSDRNCIRYTEE
jgi:hypothetical protein